MKYSILKKVTYLNREVCLTITSELMVKRAMRLKDWLGMKEFLAGEDRAGTRRSILKLCRASRSFELWCDEQRHQCIRRSIEKKMFKGLSKKMIRNIKSRLKTPRSVPSVPSC